MKINILVVDDEKLANDLFVEVLKRAGHEVSSVFSAEDALVLLKEKSFDLMLSDIRMKGMDGIQLLQKARELHPEMVVVMITAFGTIENAVKAMKLGAYDYLLKPASPDALEVIVEKASELINVRSGRPLPEYCRPIE